MTIPEIGSKHIDMTLSMEPTKDMTIIGSDNGLSPGRRQAITWTIVGVLLIGPLGTNFSEILTEIHKFSLKKCIWKCRLENGGHFVSASMC